MSISLKKWIGLTVLFIIVVFISTSLSVSRTSAQTSSTACPPGTPLTGWMWSANVGWVSLNSSNPTAGGGPHCVSIDSSNNLVGWAWSSNIGWIKFGGLSGFPTVSGASTETNARINTGVTPNQVVGWARACAGTIKSGDPYLSQNDYPAHFPQLIGDCSTMTSRPDGWDGWIELGNTTHIVASANNSIMGYSWGGSTVDQSYYWLASTTAAVSGATQCTISASAPVSGDKSSVFLEWTSANTDYCVGTNFTAQTTSGNTTVAQSPGTTQYSLWCAPKQQGGTAGTCSTNFEITGGGGGDGTTCTPGVNCPITGANPALQMYLKDTEGLAYYETRVGKTAKINWKSGTSGETFGFCGASLKDAGNPTSPDTKNFTSTEIGTITENPASYITNSFTTAGIYRFELRCVSNSSGKTVNAAAKNSAQTYLEIRVKEADLNEV
jgi:hypothetical protein